MSNEPLLSISMNYHRKAYKKKSFGYFAIYDDCLRVYSVYFIQFYFFYKGS